MARGLKRFLVAPYQSGLQEDKRAWLISNDAFTELRNAYIYRGRVRKRFGSRLFNEESDSPELSSRLRIQIGTTTSDGNFPSNDSDDTYDVPGEVYKVGQQFSVDDVLFTVHTTGTPMDMKRTDNSSATATFNTENGKVRIEGAPADKPVFFYPAEPVMGIRTYERPPLNDEDVIAFDTQFAYTLNNSQWERLSGGDDTWTGSDDDFFWSTNYRGQEAFDTIFVATNNVTDDGIRYYDGDTWTKLRPKIIETDDKAAYLETARIVLPFKDRLIAINTVETDLNDNTERYKNRCRFSVNGNPLAKEAWRQDNPGQGNYIDAPTREAAVSAEFIQDRLVVYFERSTFELAYTQNQIVPFIWRRINSELGSDSQFSIVSVEQQAVTIGNVSIHASNGSQVYRIDDKIPDRVYRIRNTKAGSERVHGIRDFQNKQIYWSIPQDLKTTYPEKVLVFNYQTQSWATADDSITTFGYIFNSFIDDTRTWESDDTWQERSDVWVEGSSIEGFMAVTAGNQEGYIFIIDPDITANAPVLSVTDIENVTDGGITLTVEQHNLRVGDFVQILKPVISDGDDGTAISSIDELIFRVDQVDDDNTITTFSVDEIEDTYLGGGILRRVSRIDIKTKEYGFFLEQGYDTFIPQIDFYVDNTELGEITCDYFTDTADLSLRDESNVTNTIFGDMIIQSRPFDTYDQNKRRLWRALYPLAEGSTIQLRLFLSDDQMTRVDTAFSDFQLHAMLFSASQATRTLR